VPDDQTSSGAQSPRVGGYPEFGFTAVTTATLIALTAGFGFVAILSIHVGFGLSVDAWWLPVLQAHGHAQLIGWLGLFIVGVSLYFVPRLTGVPLPRPTVVPLTVGLLFVGVVGQSVAGLGVDRGFGPSVIGASGVMTLAATVLYVGTALHVILRASEQRAALHIVCPLLAAALGYGVINAVVSVEAARAGQAVVDIAWNRNAVDVFFCFISYGNSTCCCDYGRLERWVASPKPRRVSTPHDPGCPIEGSSVGSNWRFTWPTAGWVWVPSWTFSPASSWRLGFRCGRTATLTVISTWPVSWRHFCSGWSRV